MMMQMWLQIACTATMGIMAGIYLIFSTTIMPSLKEVDNGAFVMAKINEVILNPVFKSIFFFSGISSAYLGMFANSTDLVFRAACLVFFIGTFLVTVLRNVPLNSDLKQATMTQNKVNDVWNRYLTSWVRWNHVRSICAISAAGLACLSSYN
jgi:uncharacterized membrane protein